MGWEHFQLNSKGKQVFLSYLIGRHFLVLSKNSLNFGYCIDLISYVIMHHKYMHVDIRLENKTNILNVRGLLTATMRFMASSFKESLLLSSISFRSSCLKM